MSGYSYRVDFYNGRIGQWVTQGRFRTLAGALVRIEKTCPPGMIARWTNEVSGKSENYEVTAR